MEKTIVIFANSVKHHQHCVAGKDIITKEWIRPVGDENGCELQDEQTKYKNKYGKYFAKPLQKMKIKFVKKSPLLNQPENHIVSDDIWIQNYKIDHSEIVNYLDSPPNLWIDNISPNDRVDYQLIQKQTIKITQSLYLIQVKKIHIYWKDRSNFEQNPQRRGIFEYNQVTYDLPLTDPNFSEFEEQDLENKFLCISLGEEFNGYCYKLIASIL
jgi:hypothetical protein